MFVGGGVGGGGKNAFQIFCSQRDQSPGYTTLVHRMCVRTGCPLVCLLGGAYAGLFRAPCARAAREVHAHRILGGPPVASTAKQGTVPTGNVFVVVNTCKLDFQHNLVKSQRFKLHIVLGVSTRPRARACMFCVLHDCRHDTIVES